MSHELQVKYAGIVAAKLRSKLVTKENVIVNTIYEGDPASGSVKIPVRDTETTVIDYSRTNLAANTVGYSSTAYITVTFNTDKVVNDYIDNYEVAALPDNVVLDRLESAAYSLAAVEDLNALTAMVNACAGKDDAGSAFADARVNTTGYAMALSEAASISASYAYSSVLALSEKLSDKNVPLEGRFLIVNPKWYNYLLTDSNFIKQSNLSQEMINNGAIGMINGCAVYQSNRLPNGADIAVGTVAHYGYTGMIMSHPDYVTRIEAFSVLPHFVPANDSLAVGGSYLKARLIMRHAVVKPEAVAILTYPVAKS